MLLLITLDFFLSTSNELKQGPDGLGNLSQPEVVKCWRESVTSFSRSSHHQAQSCRERMTLPLVFRGINVREDLVGEQEEGGELLRERRHRR